MTGDPLVSIIISCYNMEAWIGAAIESCLKQTYPNIEIIVIDDGSTDESAEIIKNYLSEIKLIQIIHSGACAARNRGFEASRGEFIQFLDADDYLLPEKVMTQVQFLRETGAEAVYGDWRHRYELKDGKYKLGEIKISGHQKDLLNSLFEGWWVAPGALLYRRSAVRETGGWDESLEAAQDTDFIISMALSETDIRYQPGCFFIYRRYGNVTISTSNRPRWLKNHLQVLDKAHAHILESCRLSTKYRKALAAAYFRLARNYFDISREQYFVLLKRTLEVDPCFKPCESNLYNWGQKLFGYSVAEQAASLKRKMLRWILNAKN